MFAENRRREIEGKAERKMKLRQLYKKGEVSKEDAESLLEQEERET